MVEDRTPATPSRHRPALRLGDIALAGEFIRGDIDGTQGPSVPRGFRNLSGLPCAHPGIVEVVEKATKVMPKEVYLVT
jgi:hypothetical protein